MPFCERPRLNICVPRVHEIVDYRIDHGVGHGQPVESEVVVDGERVLNDVLVVVGVEEVEVVGEPAQAEQHHHSHKHLYQLNCNELTGFIS